MAAGGYPGDYGKGFVISGLEETDTDDCKVFHAGTAADGDNIVTSGGRVLCITALGPDIHQALQTAYRAVDQISWEGAFSRRDIGWRALQRESR